MALSLGPTKMWENTYKRKMVCSIYICVDCFATTYSTERPFGEHVYCSCATVNQGTLVWEGFYVIENLTQ